MEIPRQTLIVKIKYQEDTRRLTLTSSPSFRDVVGIVRKLFHFEEQKSFVLKYVDDDNDLVTISSDMELQEAILVASKANPPVLRLLIHDIGSPFKPTAAPRSAAESSKAGKAEEVPPRAAPGNPMEGFLRNPLLLQQLLLRAQQGAASFGSEASQGLNDLLNQFQHLNLGEQGKEGGPPPSTENFFQQLLGHPLVQQLLRDPFLQQLASTFLGPQFGGSFPPSPPQESNSTSAVHVGVSCDGCGTQNFSGIRYKCSVCPDYDLCESCKKKDIHGPHQFTEINRPLHPFAGRGCPYSRPGNWGRRFCGPMQNRRHKDSSERFLARFVSDTTIPDGTVIEPGQKFVKIWKMRNEGTTAWPENTSLQFVGGDQLSLSDSVPVPAVAPGNEIEIAVEMTAPSKPGRFVGFWRLAQLDLSRFGQRVWVDIFVSVPSPTDSVPVTPQTTESAEEMKEEKEAAAPLPLYPVLPSAPLEEPMKMDEAPNKPEAPKEKPLSPELAQLLDMGFTDRDFLETLLLANNNNVGQVLQQLLK